jgi:ubiquinone/menaquinone biosynthesis C-methylase UbiE
MFDSRKSQRNYDILANWYDLLAAGMEDKPRQIGIDSLSIPPGGKILEIGCGTGSGMRLFEQRIEAPGTILGVDLSYRMLRQAMRKTRQENSVVIQADAFHLPFAAQTMDAVFCSFMLELFSDEMIAEMLLFISQILKPGGSWCFISMSECGGSSLMKGIYRSSQRLFPTLVDCRMIQLKSLLHRAGFVVKTALVYHLAGLPVEILSGSLEDNSYG